MTAGNVADLKWNFQTGKATPATVAAYGAYLAGGDLVRPMRTIEPFEETTGEQMRMGYYVANAHAAGAPDFYVPPKAAASLLYAVLGGVATTGGGDPYTHTITRALTRPWLTVWSALGAGMFRENRDCRVDQLVISGSANQPLRMVPTITGLDPRSSTAAEATAVIEATGRVLYYDGKGALKFEGSAVQFLDFTLTINRNPELIYSDDVIPTDNVEGLLSIQLQVSRLWVDASLDNRFHFGGASPADHTAAVKDILTLAGSPAGVEFKFTRSTGPERSIKLALPLLQPTALESPPNTSGASLRESITLEAFDDGTATEPITAIVLNGMSDLTP